MAVPSGGQHNDRASRTVSIMLRGPHHPLLFNLTAAHHVGSLKEVRVERDSVNSVLLERFPNDDHDQWMAAAHVGLNQGGNALMLRNTTFLPNQHGLGALLAMVFAPRVELRCDHRRRRYTGCLVGLGSRDKDWGKSERTGGGGASRPSKKVSYHGEHDMEIKFDVCVDNDDVGLVNKIRFYINDALSRDLSRVRKGDGRLLPLEAQRREGTLKLENVTRLIEVQENIRRNLVRVTIHKAVFLPNSFCILFLFFQNELLNRPRRHKERELFRREYHWREAPEPQYLLPCQVKIFLKKSVHNAEA